MLTPVLHFRQPRYALSCCSCHDVFVQLLLLCSSFIFYQSYFYVNRQKGLDFAWCKSSDIGLLAPDITLFLDLPISEAGKRAGFGEERYENEDFQRNVRGLFLEMKHDMKVGDIQNCKGGRNTGV